MDTQRVAGSVILRHVSWVSPCQRSQLRDVREGQWSECQREIPLLVCCRGFIAICQAVMERVCTTVLDDEGFGGMQGTAQSGVLHVAAADGHGREVC